MSRPSRRILDLSAAVHGLAIRLGTGIRSLPSIVQIAHEKITPPDGPQQLYSHRSDAYEQRYWYHRCLAIDALT